MDKKSSGGGQGSGGQKGAPAKPAPAPAAAPRGPSFDGSGTRNNPRATLDAIAAVVLPGSDPKPKTNVDPKKHLNANVFSSGTAANERKAKLPSVWTGSVAAQEEEAAIPTFNGLTPAEEVTSRDVWRAIQPPVTSKEGQRSAQLYEQVINQFAVGHNSRYEPDGPDKPRSHIFVWDVTRAMNAEIPHMLGARELTLMQTLDWLRYESSQRGWVRVQLATAVESANEGKPVIVTPKQGVSKVALLGIVRPGQVPAGGHPRVAAAAKQRGNDLAAPDALGVHALEYFIHP